MINNQAIPLIAMGITFILNGITACMRENIVLGVIEIVTGILITVSGTVSLVTQ